MPSVDATVTTVPRERSRKGSAARTTAAVPSRFTFTTRSQSSVDTSPRGPHASVAAAPRPEAPPVSRTSPRGRIALLRQMGDSGTGRRGDQPGRRIAGDGRDEHDLAAVAFDD